MKTKRIVSKIISPFGGRFWVRKKHSSHKFILSSKCLAPGFSYRPLGSVKKASRGFDISRHLKSLLPSRSKSSSALLHVKSGLKNKLLKNLKPLLSSRSRFFSSPCYRRAFSTLLILIVLSVNVLVFVRGVSAEEGFFP